MAHTHVIITVSGGRLHVRSPYNDDWRIAAKVLQGKYRGRSGLWSFEMGQRDVVIKKVLSIFHDVPFIDHSAGHRYGKSA